MQNSSYIYWKNFAWSMQNYSYKYGKNFAWGMQNYMGKILRGGTQNSSYIYGKTILRRGTLFLSAFSYIYRSNFA